ncbi:hypothetical protein OPQ81_006100 [Rhizoctonia solani]|nr:hypothetical protein OPQ81_006100 [Rhizoctonia solani]
MPTSDTGQNRLLSQSSEVNLIPSQLDGSGPQRTLSSTRSARIDNINRPTKKPQYPNIGRGRSVSGSVTPSSQPDEDSIIEPSTTTSSSGQRTPRALSPISTGAVPTSGPSSSHPVASQASAISHINTSYTSPNSTQASSVSNASLGPEAVRAAENTEANFTFDWSQSENESRYDPPPSPARSFHSIPSEFQPEREYSQQDHPTLQFIRALQDTIAVQDSVVPELIRIDHILESFRTGMTNLIRNLTFDSTQSASAYKLAGGLFSTFGQLRDVYWEETAVTNGEDCDMQGFAGSKPAPDLGATQHTQLHEILESIKALNRNFSVVNNRLTALESLQTHSQTKNPQPTPPAAPTNARNTNSYAAKVASVPQPVVAPSSAPGSMPHTKNYKSKSNPVRFVIHVGETSPASARLPEFAIYERLRPIIDQRSNSVGGRLTEVKWNHQGNLVLTFTHSTNPAAIQAIEGEIRSALRMERAGKLHRAVPWGKISVSGVATGIHRDGIPHSKETLLEELLYENPFLKNYVITQGPDWTVKPSLITSHRATISFAFEDKDGKLLPQLLRSPIRMWGTNVTSRKWNNKPLLKRCDRCISYAHNTNTCKSPFRCGRCGGAHSTDKHDAQCAPCKREVKINGAPCTHANKCPLCKDPPHPLMHLAPLTALNVLNSMSPSLPSSKSHLMKPCAMSERLIHMLQLNVAGLPSRVHTILNDKFYDNFDILLIQDPWWGKIGSEKSVLRTEEPVFGTTHSNRWLCYHPPLAFLKKALGL